MSDQTPGSSFYQLHLPATPWKALLRFLKCLIPSAALIYFFPSSSGKEILSSHGWPLGLGIGVVTGGLFVLAWLFKGAEHRLLVWLFAWFGMMAAWGIVYGTPVISVGGLAGLVMGSEFMGFMFYPILRKHAKQSAENTTDTSLYDPAAKVKRPE